MNTLGSSAGRVATHDLLSLGQVGMLKWGQGGRGSLLNNFFRYTSKYKTRDGYFWRSVRQASCRSRANRFITLPGTSPKIYIYDHTDGGIQSYPACVILATELCSWQRIPPRWRIRLSSSLVVYVGQFREFESRRVHSRIYSWGLFLVHKLTCGKRESAS